MRFLSLLLTAVLAATTSFRLHAQTDTRTAQTIAFPTLASRTYGSGPVALAATASSGLPVAYAVISGHGRISGNSLEIDGGGPIVIEATQAGNASFAPATAVRQTLMVAPISVRVTVHSETVPFDGQGHQLRVTTEPPIPSVMYADNSLFIYYNDSQTDPNAGGTNTAAVTRYPSRVGRHPVRAQIMSTRSQYSGSATGTLDIVRAPVTFAFENTTQTYDGQPKPVAVTPSPETHWVHPGLNYPMTRELRVTYDGATTPPSAAGTYRVVATVDTEGYTGSANATLTIRPAPVTVALGGLAQAADGAPKPATVTTNPAGLATTVTYNGNATPPSAPGSYAVVATVADPNYSGTATGTLVLSGSTTPPPVTPPPTQPPPPPTTPPPPPPQVGLSPQVISFPPLDSPRFGTAPLALAATASSGLPVSYVVESGPATVSDSRLTLTGAGTVTLVASQAGDSSFLPAQARLVVTVLPALANVVVENLIQTADGTPRPVTVTTMPAGLATRVTYDGASAPPSAPGTYAVVATVSDPNYTGTASATLTLTPLTPTGNAPLPAARLANVSTRGRAGASGEPLIAGFVIAGSAPTQVLVRGAGPALREFGVSDAIARARLQLFRGTELIATNERWNGSANVAELNAAARSAGAFDFGAASDDAALLVTLAPGAYTAVVTDLDARTGAALAEVYDVSGSAGRLINLSTRANLGSGGDPLITGLVVSGPAARRILLRAVGPTLRSFDVAAPLAEPQLEVFRASTVVAENRGWNDAAPLAEAARAVGAFALTAGSRDAALLVTLEPGAYTVHVRSSTAQPGTVLLEAYELP